MGVTLAAYLALESYYFRKEPAQARPADLKDYVPKRLKGAINMLLFAVVIVVMFFSDPTPRSAGGQPLHTGAHGGGGGDIRRDLRHHDPSPGTTGVPLSGTSTTGWQPQKQPRKSAGSCLLMGLPIRLPAQAV